MCYSSSAKDTEHTFEQIILFLWLLQMNCKSLVMTIDENDYEEFYFQISYSLFKKHTTHYYGSKNQAFWVGKLNEDENFDLVFTVFIKFTDLQQLLH